MRILKLELSDYFFFVYFIVYFQIDQILLNIVKNKIKLDDTVIVIETEKNQEIAQGERIGMIRFGSRVDLYFNKRKIMVKVGQNVIAGESLIAQM